jgi:RNA polymerase sigma-70 factor (ECF subfamily)
LNDVAYAVSADASQAGEREFEALIGPLVEPGLRLAYSMLGDRAEAEDATQEAITKAWRNLGRLRDRAQVRPWFLSVVANQCRNMRRTRWFRTIRLPEFFQPSAAPADLERLDIERALARLPMADRQILFMRYYLDLSVEEIAASLGISPSAAKGRIHRAAHRMRPGLLEEDI